MKAKNLIFIILLWILSSCNCDKEYHCGSISTESAAWFHTTAADTLLFADGAGDTLSFKVYSVTESNPLDKNACKKNELGGCDCEERCSVHKSFMAQSDSAGFKAGIFSQNNNEETFGKFLANSYIYYYVLDFYEDFTIKNPIILDVGDSLFSNITLGNKNYNEVYMLQHDTASVSFATEKVFKIYITKKDGVVGFDLRFLPLTHIVKSYFRVK